MDCVFKARDDHINKQEMLLVNIAWCPLKIIHVKILKFNSPSTRLHFLKYEFKFAFGWINFKLY